MIHQIVIGGVPIDVHFKDIKNVHLSVYPPTGRVRVSAPVHMTIESVQLFATSKIGWIRRCQSKLSGQPREAPREYLERESHNVWGRRYLLHINENSQKSEVVLTNRTIELWLPSFATSDNCRAALDGWYREELRAKATPLLERWAQRLDVSLSRFFIQRMKTKWGSSNPASRTVRLNLELAKYSPECLDYVALHEVAHFVVPNHNEHFREVLDTNLPGWRTIRDRLNEGPLAMIN